LFLNQRETSLDAGATRIAFASQIADSGNQTLYQIHELNLFSDFKEVLSDLGFMPEVSLDKIRELEQDKKQLEEETRAKDDRIRELEARLAASTAKLSDLTKIGGTSWGDLRTKAM